jgi:hypothetical protein
MSMMQTVSFHELIYYVLYYDKSDENNGLYPEKTSIIVYSYVNIRDMFIF